MKVVKHPLVSTLSVFAALWIAIVLQWSRSKVPFEMLLVAVILMFLLIAFIIVVTAAVMRLKNQEELDDKIADLKSVIVNNNLTWIVNQRYVQMVESNSKETWAFAQELSYAIQPDSEIFKGIQENLAKGHRYKIFMPDRPRTHKIISDYIRLHTFKKGQVQFVLVPNNEFYFHTVMVIYDVYSSDPRCIEWLPVRELNIWIEMDAEHTSRMIGVGEILMKKFLSESLEETEMGDHVKRISENHNDKKTKKTK